MRNFLNYCANNQTWVPQSPAKLWMIYLLWSECSISVSYVSILCGYCCRVLLCLREMLTVQQAVMNPVKSQTLRLRTLATVTLTAFILQSMKTTAPNKPHIAVNCQELRCQKRRANDDHSLISKLYTVPIIVMFQACLVNSCIDNVSVGPR